MDIKNDMNRIRSEISQEGQRVEEEDKEGEDVGG